MTVRTKQTTFKPSPGIVFVKQAPYAIKKNKFEYAGLDEKFDYVVTAIGKDVTVCKVGDFVLFDNYHEYESQGEKIIKVSESDIDGVTNAS